MDWSHQNLISVDSLSPYWAGYVLKGWLVKRVVSAAYDPLISRDISDDIIYSFKTFLYLKSISHYFHRVKSRLVCYLFYASKSIRSQGTWESNLI